jgi:hypothetical protein
MKFLTILTILTVSFISIAAFSCPDVSGKFLGKCDQVSSCYGTSPVVYGVEIKQNSCSDVSIAYVAWNGNSIFDINYLIDAHTNYVHKSAGQINAFVTYSSSHLYKTEKIATSVFNQTYKKIVNADGTVSLEVTDLTATKKCTVKTECTIPELK